MHSLCLRCPCITLPVQLDERYKGPLLLFTSHLNRDLHWKQFVAQTVLACLVTAVVVNLPKLGRRVAGSAIVLAIITGVAWGIAHTNNEIEAARKLEAQTSASRGLPWLASKQGKQKPTPAPTQAELNSFDPDAFIANYGGKEEQEALVRKGIEYWDDDIVTDAGRAFAGAKFFEQYGKTINDAAEFLVAHLKAVERSCTVAALVDEVIAKKKKECRHGRPASGDYLVDLNVRLGRLKKDFGGRMAATITSEEVEDWLDNLKDERTGENLSRISRAYARRDIRVRREAEVCDQKSIQGNQQANRRP